MISLRRLAPLCAILALFFAAPGKAQDTKTEPAASTPAATTANASGKKTAAPKDVDIEADQMEIFDDKKQAVFKGNVDAKRVDVRLTCDTLVVTYAETTNPDGTKKTDVTFLDATGNVKIVTDKQTVTGAWAKMDVKKNDLTVGENVKVLQGKNVLTGNKLFVDLDTNQTELSGGRVKGSFVPEK
jgi:lipopolysaccharide export system protein LptA